MLLIRSGCGKLTREIAKKAFVETAGSQKNHTLVEYFSLFFLKKCVFVEV